MADINTEFDDQVLDGSTGVTREVRTGYSKSRVLPRATVLPSHEGDFGKQMGVDVNEPLPYIIDPDYKDGGILIDPKKSNIYKVASTLKGTPTERFRQVATSENVEVQQPQHLMNDKTQPIGGKRVTKVKGSKEIISPQNTQSEGVVTLTDLARMVGSLQQQLADQGVTAEQTVAVRQHSQTTSPVVDEDSTAAGAPADRYADTVTSGRYQPVSAPEVEVTFQDKNGGRIITQFHEVVQDQSTIALIFDSRFKYGSRYIPAETPEDAPMKITMQPHNKTFNVHYFRQMFRFQHWDFMILIAAD